MEHTMGKTDNSLYIMCVPAQVECSKAKYCISIYIILQPELEPIRLKI